MSDQRPLLRVVAGIVYNRQGELLLTSRPAGKAYAGYWEFAGGKVEAGETELAALQRELAEELGITVNRALPWLVKIHSYEHARVHLRFFRIPADGWQGELQAKEGQAWAWQRPGHYTVSPMLPANADLLAALAVPEGLSGSLSAGLTDGGAYRVVPYALSGPGHARVLLTLEEAAKLGRLPEAGSVWLAVADEAGFAAAQDADVAVWTVRDEAAAQTVCRVVSAGVALPVVALADEGLAARYRARWLAAGVHGVAVAQERAFC